MPEKKAPKKFVRKTAAKAPRKPAAKKPIHEEVPPAVDKTETEAVTPPVPELPETVIAEVVAVSEESAPAARRVSWYRRRFIVITGLTLLILLTAGGLFLFAKTQSGLPLLNNASSPVQQATALIDKVGRHIVLPTGEQPTIATVSDISKLQGQVFFAHAQNGDKMLIFAKAKKAILYRPSIDKIIEVGPVETTNTANAATPTASAASQLAQKEPVKVALYNGTTTVGLTRKVEASLKEFTPVTTTVTDRDNASSSAYPTSVVVDLSGKNAAAAKQLATFAKGTVNVLPRGEIAPKDADILIILGKSYVGE